MATDNTDVLRMMRDFADLVNQNPYERHASDGQNNPISSGLQFISDAKRRISSMSGVATQLSFSNLSTSFGSQPDISLVKDDSIISTQRETLKRKLLKTEAELQHTKAALNASKASLHAAEPNNKRVCVELEAELERFKQLYEREKEHVDTLRCQLKFMMGQETELRHQLNECRQQVDTTKSDYEVKMKTWQKRYDQLKIEKEEAQTAKDDTIRELKADVTRLQSELLLAKQHEEESEELAKTLKQQIQEMRAAGLTESLQKELEKSQKKVKELEDEIEINKDAALIARTMQSEVNKLPELKKENSQLKEENRLLRETNGNMMLLQEKVWSLQEQVTRAESKGASLAKLQVENEELKDRLAQWVALAGDDATSRSPAAFSKRLSLIQTNELLLNEQIGKLSAENKELHAMKENLKKEVASLKSKLQQNSQSAYDKDVMLKRLRRKLLLISKERDSYKRVLESYENEITISGSSINSEHMQTLQNINTDYKHSLEKLEEECNELQKEVDSLRKKQSSNMCNVHIEEISSLNGQLKSQEIHLKQLQAENNVLEQRLQEISYQKDNGKSIEEKIIHLRCNPMEQAVQKKTADLQQLKQENEQLKIRIKILEEAGPTAQDITVQVQKQLEHQPPASIEELKEQLSIAEKKNKRLMEAFRKTSREFRDVYYRLTGYKITLPTQNKYQLSHMYAESPHDYLLFELASDGSLDLLETDYSRHLGSLIQNYLQKNDSIPAFLSTLTLDLFNRQTCVIRQM